MTEPITEDSIIDEDDEIISQEEINSLSQYLEGSPVKGQPTLDINGIKKMMDKVFEDELKFSDEEKSPQLGLRSIHFSHFWLSLVRKNKPMRPVSPIKHSDSSLHHISEDFGFINNSQPIFQDETPHSPLSIIHNEVEEISLKILILIFFRPLD